MTKSDSSIWGHTYQQVFLFQVVQPEEANLHLKSSSECEAFGLSQKPKAIVTTLKVLITAPKILALLLEPKIKLVWEVSSY